MSFKVTDYPFVELGDEAGEEAPTRKVELLHFDENKMARVRFSGPNDVQAMVKMGYLYDTMSALLAARAKAKADSGE